MRKNNPKTLEINKAKKQFNEDLAKDVDFIEFKKRCVQYGTVVVTSHTFLINNISPSSQTLISQYLKELKSQSQLKTHT